MKWLNVLNYVSCQILTVTSEAIQKDSEEKTAAFNPRPYFRLFTNWLFDLDSLDPILDGANFQVLVGSIS